MVSLLTYYFACYTLLLVLHIISLEHIASLATYGFSCYTKLLLFHLVSLVTHSAHLQRRTEGIVGYPADNCEYYRHERASKHLARVCHERTPLEKRHELAYKAYT